MVTDETEVVESDEDILCTKVPLYSGTEHT